MNNTGKSRIKKSLFIHVSTKRKVLSVHGLSEYKYLLDDVFNADRSALSNKFLTEIRDLIFKAESQKQVQGTEWMNHSEKLNLSIIPIYNEELIILIAKNKLDKEGYGFGVTDDLSLILSHFEEGVLLEDSERKILFINEKFREMLNLKREIKFYIGLSTLNLIYELSRVFHNMDSFYELFTSINDQSKGSSVSDITLNDSLIVEREFIPIEEAGRTTAYLWKLRDITDRKKSESKLQSYLDIMLEQTQATSQIQSAIITKGVEQFDDLVISTYFPYFMDSLGAISDMIQLSDDKYLYFIADISHTGTKSVLYASAVKSVLFKLSRELELLSADEILKLLFSKLEQNLRVNLGDSADLKVLMAVFDIKGKVLKTTSLNLPDLVVFDSSKNKIDTIESASSIDDLQERTVEMNENTMLFMYTHGIFSLKKDNTALTETKLTEILHKYYREFSYKNLFPDNFERIMAKEGYENSGKNYLFVNIYSQILEDKVMNVSRRRNNHLYCIQSMLSEVGRIGRNCEFLSKRWTGDTWLSYKVELIVNEFLNNIIVHGLDSRKDSNIFVILSFDDVLGITFIDEGKEWILNFNESKSKNKEDFIRNMDEMLVLNERGRGISMIKELAQEAVRSRIDRYNCTQFRLYLNKE